MTNAHEDPAFQAMCREHDIEGTAQVALCGAFWNRARVSGAGEEPGPLPRGGLVTLRNVVATLRENGRYEDEEGEPTDALEDLRDWLDSLSTCAAPGAAIAAREQEAADSGFVCADCKAPLRAGWTCDACGSDAAEEATPAAAIPAAPSYGDMVLIPRGLIGAACAAIRLNHPAEKTLAELRRYTFGDLAQPTTVQQAEVADLREGLGQIAVAVKDNPVMLRCCRLIDERLAALKTAPTAEPGGAG